ncbi:hypothetical protein [Roseomonas indoligenes]|uniref:hypothetical protein n=1 Tax=Roseomonas indoligenes TaxID=2820811 RepID=UPI001FD84E6A|nr:hypothetical protein [Pararoseomonas indoligenes]
MKLSARNLLAGKVVGATITASVTNEAVDALERKVGDEASAIIKASDGVVRKGREGLTPPSFPRAARRVASRAAGR